VPQCEIGGSISTTVSHATPATVVHVLPPYTPTGLSLVMRVPDMSS
jgi:hypothetical protein